MTKKKSIRRVDFGCAGRYPGPMAPETMDAPDAVEELKDYEYERLDAVTEIRAFGRLIQVLERTPSSATAEALCLGSRRLRYAIREEPCEIDTGSVPTQQHRKKAVALLEQAVALRSSVLAAIPSKEHARVKRFFINITKRRNDLAHVTA